MSVLKTYCGGEEVRLIPLVSKSQLQNPEERIPRKRLSMVTFVMNI
jgi:hypothetical protein